MKLTRFSSMNNTHPFFFEGEYELTLIPMNQMMIITEILLKDYEDLE
jgi:hypothetical protein